MTILRPIWVLMIAVGLIAGAACSRDEPSVTDDERAVDSSQPVDDATITTAVKAKLASEVEVETLTNVDVDTMNGVVTLQGEVESQAAKSQAEEVARTVEGVLRVNNNIVVKTAGAGAASY